MEHINGTQHSCLTPVVNFMKYVCIRRLVTIDQSGQVPPAEATITSFYALETIMIDDADLLRTTPPTMRPLRLDRGTLTVPTKTMQSTKEIETDREKETEKLRKNEQSLYATQKTLSCFNTHYYTLWVLLWERSMCIIPFASSYRHRGRRHRCGSKRMHERALKTK